MGKRFLAALVAGLLLWTFFSQDTGVDRAPAAADTPVQDVLTSQSPTVPATEKNSAPPSAQAPARQARFNYDPTVIERHLNQASAAEPGLVPSLQAIPRKQYQSSMGPELGRQSGYVLYKSERAQSSVEAFDGVHLPVVKFPGRAALGVVTGDIEVVFKTVPDNLPDFARRLNLELAAEMRNIKTAFFTAKSYPADLTRFVSRLLEQPEVKSAEISIVFGSRRAR